MEMKDVRTLLLGLMVFFYISHLARFISQVFVLNFSTSGLNSSIILIIFFLTGLDFLVLDKIGKLPMTLNRYLVISMVIFNIISLVNFALIALISSLLGMAVICLVIIQYSGKEELRTGFVLGVGLNITFQVVFQGLNPFATLLTKGVFLLLTLAFVAIYVYNYNIVSSDTGIIVMKRIYLVQALLVLSSVFFAFPYVVASWTNESATVLSLVAGIDTTNLQHITPVIMAIFGLVGLLLALNTSDSAMLSTILSVGFVIALLILVRYTFLPIIIYAFLIFSTAKIVPNSVPSVEDKLGPGLFGIQFVLLILLFLQVTAGHWVFLPSAVHGILQGMAWLYLGLIGLVIALIAFMEVRA